MHYTPINDGSIKDGSVLDHHIEETQVDHAFVCIKQSKKLPTNLNEVSDEVYSKHI